MIKYKILYKDTMTSYFLNTTFDTWESAYDYMHNNFEDTSCYSLEEIETKPKLSREEVFETADKLYFIFMDQLCDSDRAEFVEPDPDNPEGTRDTEKGKELFDDIEATLEEL